MPILAAVMSKGAVPSSGSSRSSRRDRPGSLVPNRAGDRPKVTAPGTPGPGPLKLSLKTVAPLYRRATGTCSPPGWYRRIEPDVATERPTTRVLYAGGFSAGGGAI